MSIILVKIKPLNFSFNTYTYQSNIITSTTRVDIFFSFLSGFDLIVFSSLFLIQKFLSLTAVQNLISFHSFRWVLSQFLFPLVTVDCLVTTHQWYWIPKFWRPRASCTKCQQHQYVPHVSTVWLSRTSFGDHAPVKTKKLHQYVPLFVTHVLTVWLQRASMYQSIPICVTKCDTCVWLPCISCMYQLYQIPSTPICELVS